MISHLNKVQTNSLSGSVGYVLNRSEAEVVLTNIPSGFRGDSSKVSSALLTIQQTNWLIFKYWSCSFAEVIAW